MKLLAFFGVGLGWPLIDWCLKYLLDAPKTGTVNLEYIIPLYMMPVMFSFLMAPYWPAFSKAGIPLLSFIFLALGLIPIFGGLFSSEKTFGEILLPVMAFTAPVMWFFAFMVYDQIFTECQKRDAVNNNNLSN